MLPEAENAALIDELIADSQGATIKDYREWVEEFEQISSATDRGAVIRVFTSQANRDHG